MEYGKVSDNTKRVRSLIDRLAALASENAIGIDEVSSLIEEIAAGLSDVDDVFVSAANKLLLQIAKDGEVSEQEMRLLSSFGALYANPVSDDPVEEVAGKAFVLTGDFETEGGKATVAEMVEAAGGEVKAGVSKKVSYVVMGGLGSDAWAFDGFGQKVKKALDLKLTGKASIDIVTENALISYFSASSPEAIRALNERRERFGRQWESAKVAPRDLSGLTEGQSRALGLVKSGRNVYLTGLGGTGKSYLLNQIIDWAEREGKNVIICAPTGIAALNVGGCTVHRALGIRPEKTLQPSPYPYIADGSPILDCDLVIVDEISMCRMDLFDYLSSVLKKAAGIRAEDGRPACQLIVVGDFCQLPPVVTKEEKAALDLKYGYNVRGAYPFMGVEWDSWDFEKVELVEAIRQRDADFVAALNACRVGDTNGLHWIEAHAAQSSAGNAIVLCGTNEEAARENRKRLDALSSEEAVYAGRIVGDVESGDLPTAKRLRLKEGARVMALANDSEQTYMNGSLGEIVSCGVDSVRVRFDNGYEGVLASHKWEIKTPTVNGGKVKMETIGSFVQLPLKLAYAMTIHKAQGQTFEAASIYPRCWDPGQLYTALSRLTGIKGLHFAHPCPDSSLIVSPDVIDFIEGRPIKHEAIFKVTPSDKDGDQRDSAAS